MPDHIRKDLWIIDRTPFTQTRCIVELDDGRHFKIVPIAVVDTFHGSEDAASYEPRANQICSLEARSWQPYTISVPHRSCKCTIPQTR